MAELEDISDDELAAVLRAPQAKPRKKKKVERTYRDWFYNTNQSIGECSDPECPDTRGYKQVMVAEVDGKVMCRFSFLAGYGKEDD